MVMQQGFSDPAGRCAVKFGPNTGPGLAETSGNRRNPPRHLD